MEDYAKIVAPESAVQGMKFVNTNYKDYKANYEKIYVFLQSHDEQELTIEQLDITALTTLVLHYDKQRYI